MYALVGYVEVSVHELLKSTLSKRFDRLKSAEESSKSSSMSLRRVYSAEQDVIVCVRACVCVPAYACTRTCLRAYVHAFICVCMYACVHACA